MTRTLEQRVGELEVEVAALGCEMRVPPRSSPAKPKDGWDRAEIVSKFLIPAALIVVTYLVKDSVDFALRRQQIEISSASGMEEMIATLRGPTVDEAAATTAALTLAAFGLPAISLLINELESGTPASRVGARQGLAMLAVVHPEETCRALQAVVETNRRRFSWRAHLTAIELLGRADCKAAFSALSSYRSLVPDSSASTLDRYKGEVYDDPAPSIEAIRQISAAVNRALQLMGARQ